MRFIEWSDEDDGTYALATADIKEIWLFDAKSENMFCAVSIEVRGESMLRQRRFYWHGCWYYLARWRARRAFRKLLRLLNK